MSCRGNGTLDELTPTARRSGGRHDPELAVITPLVRQRRYLDVLELSPHLNLLIGQARQVVASCCLFLTTAGRQYGARANRRNAQGGGPEKEVAPGQIFIRHGLSAEV
jgi:hypothetical protein